ncbi:MAG TPA: tetratricopeptide repeat protein [Gemmatimonadaceae bacterium]|nr:tetratricopeptide repeat protein [Gemmatimonadaceae bacterium]
MSGRRWALVAPFVITAATGCFATRGDVAILQNDVQSLRSESARADSLHRAELDRVIRTLGSMRDTLGVINARFGRWQGDVRSDMRVIGEQLIAIQELTGQSQRRLQELRADLERRGQGASVTPAMPGAGAPGGGGSSAGAPAAGSPPLSTTAPAGAAAAADPNMPGPNEMLQIALDQLRRGSGGAARTALRDLLANYADADVAPDAQYYLAESWATDGNEAEADAAYVQVYTKYPRSPRAPTALYKHGMILRNGGRNAEARAAFDRVVKDYPRSDAAVLAREQLSAR